MVLQRHRAGRRREDGGPGDQVLRRRGRELLPGRRALGDGDVAGGVDKLLELLVRHVGLVHPEAVHIDPVDGDRVAGNARQAAERFAGRVAAHRELAAGNPDHALRRRARRRRGVGLGREEARGRGRRSVRARLRSGEAEHDRGNSQGRQRQPDDPPAARSPLASAPRGRSRAALLSWFELLSHTRMRLFVYVVFMVVSFPYWSLRKTHADRTGAARSVGLHRGSASR